jgi:hypothetical protein
MSSRPTPLPLAAIRNQAGDYVLPTSQTIAAVAQKPEITPADFSITTSPGTGPAGPQEGWLVALGITNPGHAPVSSQDFSAPLAFEVPRPRDTRHRIQPKAGDPSRKHGTTAARSPHIRTTDNPADNHTGRLELSGDFLLRPGDSH